MDAGLHVLVVVEAVALAIVVASVMAHVVALAVMAALAVVLVEQHSQYIDERERSTLERWNGEEYNIHRHERLSVGLQILLPGGQEREGADVVGDGQGRHRLYPGARGGLPRAERGVGLYRRRAVSGD